MVENKDWQFSIPTEVGLLTVEGNEFFITSAGFGSGTEKHAAPTSKDTSSTGLGNCALKHQAEKQVKSFNPGYRLW